MCVEVPVQVVQVDTGRSRAQVVAEGRRESVLLVALDAEDGALRPGDWLLVHCGLAVRRIGEEEARERIELVTAARRAEAGHG